MHRKLADTDRYAHSRGRFLGPLETSVEETTEWSALQPFFASLHIVIDFVIDNRKDAVLSVPRKFLHWSFSAILYSSWRNGMWNIDLCWWFVWSLYCCPISDVCCSVADHAFTHNKQFQCKGKMEGICANIILSTLVCLKTKQLTTVSTSFLKEAVLGWYRTKFLFALLRKTRWIWSPYDNTPMYQIWWRSAPKIASLEPFKMLALCARAALRTPVRVLSMPIVISVWWYTNVSNLVKIGRKMASLEPVKTLAQNERVCLGLKSLAKSV